MRTILIADDSREFCELLKAVLEEKGYGVMLAASGNEAVALQRDTPAQILITDLLMPDGDGFEAIEAFRKEFPQTKVLAISGMQNLDAERYLQAARLMGAHMTFRKPLDYARLIQTIQSL
jgi:CheY-like chemotaxis protein